MGAADIAAFVKTTTGKLAVAATLDAAQRPQPAPGALKPITPERLGIRPLAMVTQIEATAIRHRRCVHLGPPVGVGSTVHHCTCEDHDFDRCLPNHLKCSRIKDAALRSCLDCSHHLPQWPFPASLRMSRASVLAHLAKGPGHNWANGWTSWLNVRDTMRELAEAAIRDCPPPPTVSGRGIVTCGGGKYEPGLYVLVRMLRHLGCELPVQVWHRGAAEPVSGLVRSLPNVTVHDLTVIPSRTIGGWESKITAVMNSGFAEVLFLDADAYPVADPTPWFDRNPTGLVIWADKGTDDTECQGTRFNANSYGIPIPTHCPRINGGHYLIDVARTWAVLNLHHHYDSYSDYWYSYKAKVGGYGDQDQMRAAVCKLRFPYHRYAEAVLDHRTHAWVQAGPDGAPGIVHRIGSKFGLPGDFGRLAHRCDVPMEGTAWAFFDEWRRASGVMERSPDRRCGVVIGAYNLPGLVALQLELIAATCGGVPVLVHHDGENDAVAAVATRYGADFRCAPRQGHSKGDIAATLAGIEWGKERGLEAVAKLSQRFLITRPYWLQDGAAALLASPANVMSQPCGTEFPVRSEAMVLRVAAWGEASVRRLLNHPTSRPGDWGHSAEHTYGAVAGALLPWSIITPNRHERRDGVVWRFANSYDDYVSLAEAYEVELGDFHLGEWKDREGGSYRG